MDKLEIKNAGIVWLIILNDKLFASTTSLQGAIDRVYAQWQPMDMELTIDCRGA